MERHEQIEKSVLGSMLAEPYLIVDGEVKLDFFISQIHKNIFGCMQALLAKQRPVDYVTLLTMMEPICTRRRELLSWTGEFCETDEV